MATTLTPAFREQFANLTERDVVTVLGWLLEPGQGDPQPNISDSLLDALEPLYRAYVDSYPALVIAAPLVGENAHITPWHVVDALRSAAA